MTEIIIIFSTIVFIIYAFACMRKILKEQKNVNLKEDSKHGIKTPDKSKMIMERMFRDGKWD